MKNEARLRCIVSGLGARELLSVKSERKLTGRCLTERLHRATVVRAAVKDVVARQRSIQVQDTACPLVALCDSEALTKYALRLVIATLGPRICWREQTDKNGKMSEKAGNCFSERLERLTDRMRACALAGKGGKSCGRLACRDAFRHVTGGVWIERCREANRDENTFSKSTAQSTVEPALSN